MQGGRLADDDSNREEDESNEGAEPPPGEEQQVKLTALSKQDDAIKEEPLSPPIRYDEWDYVIGRERSSWCTLLEKPAPEGDPHAIEEILDRNQDLVNRVKYLVKAGQVELPLKFKKRLERDRPDLDACINATILLRTDVSPDPHVHTI